LNEAICEYAVCRITEDFAVSRTKYKPDQFFFYSSSSGAKALLNEQNIPIQREAKAWFDKHYLLDSASN
jgi:hypothetical protein